MHYPSTVEVSDGVGEAIANYVGRHVKRGSTHGSWRRRSISRTLAGPARTMQRSHRREP
jgi:hypothetical protein